MTGPPASRDLFDRLERFYDAVPRSGADAEDHGPFTIFISRGAWSYYARPRLGFDGTCTATDVASVRQRQRELGVRETFEWVVEKTPSLSAALRADGLTVDEVPLLILNEHRPAPVPAGYRLRRIEADDPDLNRVLAVAGVAFSHAGSAIGEAGVAARDQRAAEDTADHASLRARLADRLFALSVIEDDEGPIASAGYQVANDVTEIVGVATLPVARRRGLGAAVTSALIENALEAGIGTIFLSAASDDTARIYRGLGFEQIGQAGLAEPPPPPPSS